MWHNVYNPMRAEQPDRKMQVKKQDRGTRKKIQIQWTDDTLLWNGTFRYYCSDILTMRTVQILSVSQYGSTLSKKEILSDIVCYMPGDVNSNEMVWLAVKISSM